MLTKEGTTINPRVFVWKINDIVFCELKIALHTKMGDVRTSVRERGRQAHEKFERAIAASPLPKADSREEAARLRSARATILMAEVPLLSERLGLQGRADFLIWNDHLNYFELKTGTAPRVPNRQLETLAFESDAAQALAYGILLEEEFNDAPLVWIIYNTKGAFAVKLKAAAAAPNVIASEIMKTLAAAKPVKVPFTPENRSYVEKLVEKVRTIKQHPDSARRSHKMAARCASCAYRPICPEKIE